MTSSTCAASRPVCSSRRLMTMAPSSGAGISARLPWKLPMAVRVAATMTTSCMGLILLAWQSKSFADEYAPTGTNKKHPGDTPYVVACSGAVDNLELHLRHMLGHDQPAGGLGDDFLDAHTWRTFAQDEGVVLDLQIGQIGEHLANAATAGQWQAAMLQQLGLAVLGGVGHGDDDVLGTGHQVHGAAHALDQLAGDHPRGDVAAHVHLERAEHGQVDMAATDHGEGLRGVEDRR